MTISLKRPCLAVAFAASSYALAPALHAQSLAMSYKLDPRSPVQMQRATLAVERCAALTWSASLASPCNLDVIGRPAVRSLPAERAHPGEAGSGEQAASAAPRIAELADGLPPAAAAFSASYALPTLGSPADVRVGLTGGREPVTGPARSVDLNFRFGSRYRMKASEESWEVYRQYADVTSENRAQSRDARAVAVELLFPFQ